MACGGRDYHASCPWSNGFHCRLRFYTRTSPRAQGRNRILCSTRTQRAIFYYIGFNVNSAMQMVDNSKSYTYEYVRTRLLCVRRRVLVRTAAVPRLLHWYCCTRTYLHLGPAYSSTCWYRGPGTAIWCLVCIIPCYLRWYNTLYTHSYIYDVRPRGSEEQIFIRSAVLQSLGHGFTPNLAVGNRVPEPAAYLQTFTWKFWNPS